MSTATLTAPPPAPRPAARAPAKPFKPGTTGWTLADLDDPAVLRQWEAGRYEIVEGVLTEMAAAMLGGSAPLLKLMIRLDDHMTASGLKGLTAAEVDVALSDDRVPRADGALLLPGALAAHKRAARRAGRRSWRRSPILVPPTLIVESISPGHEAHDRRTKRRWYAEAGVGHYWILDGYARTLDCLTLRGRSYHRRHGGRGDERIDQALFPGLVIPLAELWNFGEGDDGFDDE